MTWKTISMYFDSSARERSLKYLELVADVDAHVAVP